MTHDSVDSHLTFIRARVRDPEVAHSVEDNLHWAFIVYVAQEAPEPFASLARHILTTDDIPFTRYYA